MKRSDVFKSVTDRIILGLEKGIVPWRNPLRDGLAPCLPKNFVTGNHYSGINVLLLSMEIPVMLTHLFRFMLTRHFDVKKECVS
jgi:antirestriction protein ArdC